MLGCVRSSTCFVCYGGCTSFPLFCLLLQSELQDFVHNGRHLPRHQVVLCFGDEYPDPQRQRKMITAQVLKHLYLVVGCILWWGKWVIITLTAIYAPWLMHLTYGCCVFSNMLLAY